MHYKYFHFLLALLVFIVPIGFLTTYLVAVLNGHVEPDFPYISDTGAKPPESCIFGQFLTIGSFLTFIVVYIRYHHVKLCINTNAEFDRLTKFNKTAFVLGIGACFGVTLVGNFQEQNVDIVHYIGALLGFGGLIVYLFLHAYLAHQLKFILVSTDLMLYLRLSIGIMASVFLIITIIFSYVAWYKFKGENKLHWKREDGGFTEHIISTACEWAMAITEMLGLLTFYQDFQRIRVPYPVIEDVLLAEVNASNNDQIVHYSSFEQKI